MKPLKNISLQLLPFLIVIAALYGFSIRTNNFSDFTTYSYELGKAKPIGHPLPDSLYILMEDGRQTSLLQQTKGHYTLLSPVFLSCPSVCRIITGRLATLYGLLGFNGKHANTDFAHLQVLTLSFDGAHDDIARLKAFKSSFLPPGSMQEDPNWRFSVIDSKDEDFIKRQLATIGFWFYPTTTMPGMYNHSPYLYLINPQGIVEAVYDPGKISDIALKQQLSVAINK